MNVVDQNEHDREHRGKQHIAERASWVDAADKKVVDSVKGGDRIDSVTIEGDASGLLAAQSARIADWDKALAP